MAKRRTADNGKQFISLKDYTDKFWDHIPSGMSWEDWEIKLEKKWDEQRKEFLHSNRQRQFGMPGW